MFNFMLTLIGLGVLMSSHNTVFVLDWGLHSSNELQLSSTFFFDFVSMTFIITVSFVSSVVMNYSRSYMSDCSMANKFFITMIMFIVSMIIMSSSANMFWLMVGWDGLGLTSFFLIMYFQNWNSLNSSMVTFISNRIGDLFMIMGMIWMFNMYSLSSYCFSLSFSKSIAIVTSMMIMLAGMSKSAQIPFSAWLPLAMAAPTPVSALVHSSTLVTAGVYLMIRFFPVIDNYVFSYCMLFISSTTMILASLSAIWEFDLKKIIALSTLSHIGFMMFFISINEIPSALIHMLTHAIFKSLLFMCAGVMIHEMANLQDIRRMCFPPHVSYMVVPSFMISLFSMMGLPFMSGFYSKDFMVLKCIDQYSSIYIYLMVMISACLTCAYSTRVAYYVLLNGVSSCVFFMKESHKTNEMHNSMNLMSLAATFIGGSMINIIISANDFSISMTDPFVKLNLLMCMTIGLLLGLMAIILDKYVKHINVKEMCNNMWFVGDIMLPFQRFYLTKSSTFFNLVDIKGWLDFITNTSFVNSTMKMFILTNKNLEYINMNILLIGMSLVISQVAVLTMFKFD